MYWLHWIVEKIRSHKKKRNVDRLVAKGNVQELIEVLNGALTHRNYSDFPKQAAAVEALGRIGDSGAVENLIRILGDMYIFVTVRMAAAEALGRIGDEQALKPLVDALRDPDPSVESKAGDALVKFGKAAIGPVLAGINDVYKRRNAVEVLGKIGDTQVIEPVVATLLDSSWAVRAAAGQALTLLGWQPMDDKQRANRAVALEQWEEAVSMRSLAIEPLLVATNNFENENQWWWKAVEALAKIGDSRAAKRLASVLVNRSTPTYLQQIVSQALLGMGQAAVQPLRDAYEKADFDLKGRAKGVLETLGERYF